MELRWRALPAGSAMNQIHSGETSRPIATSSLARWLRGLIKARRRSL